MAEITIAINQRHSAGSRRFRKQTPKTDMTPMVDLGFLLISFFVITTELSKPATANLNMPKDGANMPLGESNALTVLLGKHNTIFYYQGEWTKAYKANQIFKTGFSTRWFKKGYPGRAAIPGSK